MRQSVAADDAHGFINNLYLLQERAPRPVLVPCERRVANRPDQYGSEFHGLIERADADRMLRDVGEGAYLVRASKRGADAFTLCIMFDGNVLNYRLYFDGMHYVAEKRFETLELLVADGLIAMFVDKHASDYISRMASEAIYEHSPYLQYTRAAAIETADRATSRSPQPRAHSFAAFTFKMPNFCDYCRNFLWGLVQQGVRCENCGFAAHRKCSEQARNDCRPDCKYIKRMFAVDLSTLCLAHAVAVPPVLQQCIAEINRRGLESEGIYRVSGSHEQIDGLRRRFDAGVAVDLTSVEDIHSVAGLLKLYLRLLPRQLVPFDAFRALLAAYNSTRVVRERGLRCRVALEQLDEANQFTLAALLDHLRLVVDHSSHNKMTAENISTIFSPTLFCTGATPAIPQHQHALLNFLLKNPSLIPLPHSNVYSPSER